MEEKMKGRGHISNVRYRREQDGGRDGSVLLEWTRRNR